MNLDNGMLIEICQKNTNTIWFHLYVEPEKQNKKQNRNKYRK